MLRFIHTADIQIGMATTGAGHLAPQLQEARVEALERVLAVAREQRADFVLIAGDLFEHNRVSDALVQRVAHVLRRTPVPVFITAGNHDYYGANSVYMRNSFQQSGARVLGKREPVALPEFDVTLYPCSCLETHSPESPIAWVQKQPGTTYHVCIAHGNMVEHIAGSNHDFPMRENEITQLGMDYTALGHWHSVYPDPERAPASPFFYSGTPEPTKFGETKSGYVLLVELGTGTRAVTALPTAQHQYIDIERELRSDSDVRALQQEIEALPNPERSLVRFVLTGVVSLEVREQLNRVVKETENRVAVVVLNDANLMPMPTDEDIQRFSAGSVAARALERLCQLREQATESERLLYSRAIALAYKEFSQTEEA